MCYKTLMCCGASVPYVREGTRPLSGSHVTGVFLPETQQRFRARSQLGKAATPSLAPPGCSAAGFSIWGSTCLRSRRRGGSCRCSRSRRRCCGRSTSGYRRRATCPRPAPPSTARWRRTPPACAIWIRRRRGGRGAGDMDEHILHALLSVSY
jgi:hypothetical protein